MRNKRIIWAAAALMLLAGLSGCQKTDYNGKEIRFTATSQGAPDTKTQYSGVTDSHNIERIDWVSGDKVRIYSDVATASNDAEYHWADYAISNITPSGATSKGELTVTSAHGGLTWGTGTHKFYAVYPAPTSAEADKGTVKGPAGSGIVFSIPASQTGKATTVKSLEDGMTDMTVYYPSTENAYLLAYASRAEADAAAPLDFSPAYTAFHISAGRDDKDITINSVSLKASSTNALAGNVTATNDGSGWSYAKPVYSAGGNDVLTFFFDGSAPVLTTSNPTVDFVLYALPQDLTQLTLEFNLTIDSSPAKRTLKLKTATAGSYYGRSYGADDWLIFNACKKSYIKGLLIPGSTWTIDNTTEIKMQESVADWEDDTTINPVEYGTSGIIFNATGLNQTGTGGKSFDFSLFAPAGKIWKVTARNASDGFVATDVVLKLETGSASTGGVLSGTIGSPNPWIHFTADSGPAGNYYLTFSVDVDGTEYSIDSEVARGGWGTGKTYSYFSF